VLASVTALPTREVFLFFQTEMHGVLLFSAMGRRAFSAWQLGDAPEKRAFWWCAFVFGAKIRLFVHRFQAPETFWTHASMVCVGDFAGPDVIGLGILLDQYLECASPFPRWHPFCFVGIIHNDFVTFFLSILSSTPCFLTGQTTFPQSLRSFLDINSPCTNTGSATAASLTSLRSSNYASVIGMPASSLF